MKNFTSKIIAVFLLAIILFPSCASTTLITTHNVTDAKVYINNQFVGTAPYKHKDTKIVGSTIDIKIEKEGYYPFLTTIQKDEKVDVGAIIGGLFFLFPFLWTMEYNPNHIYELTPIAPSDK